MKLLTFVDLHCSDKALKKLTKKVKIENPDLICCSGDISIVDRGTERIVSELNTFGKRVLIIPGNHEDETNLEKVCRCYSNIYYLHKKSYIFQDVLFLGYGTGGFSTIDNYFNIVSKNFLRQMMVSNGKKVVLLVHAPPYNTNLDTVMSQPCGNKTIRDFIIKHKPTLVVCGHLHENAGKEDFLGMTRIINPGPDGRIVLL